MTIQGAIYELNNMLSSNDIPCYWKPAIKKIIETVEQNVGMCQQNVGEMSEKQIDGDLISRESVKDLIRGLTKWGVRSQDGKFENVGLLYDDVMFGIDRLPSAEKTDSFIPQEDVAGILNTVESALKGTNYEVVGYDNTDGFLKVLIDMK